MAKTKQVLHHLMTNWRQKLSRICNISKYKIAARKCPLVSVSCLYNLSGSLYRVSHFKSCTKISSAKHFQKKCFLQNICLGRRLASYSTAGISIRYTTWRLSNRIYTFFVCVCRARARACGACVRVCVCVRARACQPVARSEFFWKNKIELHSDLRIKCSKCPLFCKHNRSLFSKFSNTDLWSYPFTNSILFIISNLVVSTFS